MPAGDCILCFKKKVFSRLAPPPPHPCKCLAPGFLQGLTVRVSNDSLCLPSFHASERRKQGAPSVRTLHSVLLITRRICFRCYVHYTTQSVGVPLTNRRKGGEGGAAVRLDTNIGKSPPHPPSKNKQTNKKKEQKLRRLTFQVENYNNNKYVLVTSLKIHASHTKHTVLALSDVCSSRAPLIY